MNDNKLKDPTPIEALQECIGQYKESLRTIDEIIEVVKDHREYTKMKLDMAIDGLKNLL